MEFEINGRKIGAGSPVYFIADIAANHDGDLERAKGLIRLAKQAGADAAKFQNFQAETIVSDHGYKSLMGQSTHQHSHQSSWGKPVFEVYADYSIPLAWTKELKAECDRVGIDYFSSLYNSEAVDFLNDYMPAYKIGSGDITWLEMIKKIAGKQKPTFLAVGASTLDEVVEAVDTILQINPRICLMQCNTNYTASDNNFDCINLNVLKTFRMLYPQVVLGLSDHTHGHATVLGAVALGAKAIEKHFTDDNSRDGPDHKFAMNPKTWRDMVDRTRELERALGTGTKLIEDNETETVILQRRCLRAAGYIPSGTMINADMLEVLRPAPTGSIYPKHLPKVVGQLAKRDIERGEAVYWEMLGSP